MSEQEQEQSPIEAPAAEPEAAPIEAPAPEHAPDEEEEAGEAEQADAEQVEGVPEQPQGVSEKQIEQVFKKFEKSSKVWRERVATIMGDDSDVLLACPMCDPL